MRKQTIKIAVTFAIASVICANNFALANDLSKKIIKIKEVKAKAKKLSAIEKTVQANESYGGPEVSLGSVILKRNPQTTNAQSILNNAPGISVTNPGPVAARVHTSVRGFNSTEVGYTFDNLPITSFFVGGLNGGNVFQDDSYGLSPITSGETSGINIIYGPPKPSVNSFGAIGGVINYKPLLPNNKFSGEVFGGYGSYNTRTYGASVNTGNIGTNGGRLIVRYSGRTTNNYYLNNVPATTNSYYIAYVLPSKSGFSKLTAIWYLNNFNGNIPDRMPIDLLNKFGRYYQWPTNTSYSKAKGTFMEAVVNYKDVINNHLLFNSKIYYQQQNYKRLEYDNFLQTNPYVANVTTEYPGPYGPQVSYDPSLQGVEYHLFYVNNTSVGLNPYIDLVYPKIDIEAGWLSVASFSHNGGNWYGTPDIPVIQGYNDDWDEHQHRFYNKFYVQAKWVPFAGLNIYPGVKYEIVNSLDNDTPGIFYPVGASAGNTYSLPSAYFGVSYHLTKKIKVFANYALAYKYPNMSAYYGVTDEASVGVPPPPVKVVPEFVNSYQIGLAYKGRDIGASLIGYKNYFQNTFSTYVNPVSGLSYQINSGASTYEGINLSADIQLTNNIGLYGNYSIQSAAYGSSFSNQFGYNVAAGTPKQYTPTYLANLGVNANYDHIDGTIWANFTGPQYIGTYGGSPDIGVSMHGYTTLNLSLKYPVKINKFGLKKVSFGFNIDNIINSDSYVFEKSYPYQNVTGSYLQGQPMAPRFIGVNMSLKF